MNTISDYISRTTKLLDIIVKYDPDIICLQEALPCLTENESKLEQYISPFSHVYVNNTSIRAYGERIFVKKNYKITEKGYKALRSYQGRVLSWIIVNDIFIGTFHLESNFPNQKTREKQIEDCLKIATKSNKEKFVFIGDTNFSNSESFPNEWKDPFIDKPIPTFHHSKKIYSARYDRAYIKNIEISDKIVISSSELSDHDGIMITIET